MVRGNRQWVGSYLTPDAKLVPVFNCNPPADLGQTCEPQGTRCKTVNSTSRQGTAAFWSTTADEAGQHPGLYLP